jgi:thiol-disulfide isomerase/thioredoxin
MGAGVLLLAALTVLQSPAIGDALRSLDARDLSGRAVTPAALAGRVVLIDVWATWCAPCLADLPMLRDLRRDLGDEIAIVGVSLDRMPRRDFVSWLRRHDVTWPQHFDGRGYASPLARALDVEAVPATLVIGRDGAVVARNVRGEALRALLHRLAAARARVAGGRR